MKKIAIYGRIGGRNDDMPKSLLKDQLADTDFAGVNIGGLGTPVASLASLITLKLYMNTQGAKVMKFIGVFTLANVVGLVILLGFEFFV